MQTCTLHVCKRAKSANAKQTNRQAGAGAGQGLPRRGQKKYARDPACLIGHRLGQMCGQGRGLPRRGQKICKRPGMPHRSQARADVRAGAGAYLGAGKKYAKDPACLIGHRQGQTCGQAGRRVCSSVQGRGAGACQAGCAGHARATCMGMCLPQLGKKPSGKKPSSRHGSLAVTIPSHPIPSGPIPSGPIRSHRIPSDPIGSHPIAISSHPIQPALGVLRGIRSVQSKLVPRDPSRPQECPISGPPTRW